MSRQTQMSRRPMKKTRCLGKKGRKLKITHFRPKRYVKPLAKISEIPSMFHRKRHSKKNKKKKKIASQPELDDSVPTPFSDNSKCTSSLQENSSQKRISTPSTTSKTKKSNSEGQATPQWSSKPLDSSQPQSPKSEHHSGEKTFNLNKKKKAARFKVNWTKQREERVPMQLTTPKPYRYKSPVSAKASMAAWYREADDKRRKLNAHNEREKARGRVKNIPLPFLTPVIPKGLPKSKEIALQSMIKSVPQLLKGKSAPQLLKGKSAPQQLKTKSVPQLLKAKLPVNRKLKQVPLLTMIKRALAKHPPIALAKHTALKNTSLKSFDNMGTKPISSGNGFSHPMPKSSRVKAVQCGRDKKGQIPTTQFSRQKEARPLRNLVKHSRFGSKHAQIQRDLPAIKRILYNATCSAGKPHRSISKHAQTQNNVTKWKGGLHETKRVLAKPQRTFSKQIPTQQKLPTWKRCVPKTPRSLATWRRTVHKPQRPCIFKPKSCFTKSQRSTAKHVRIQPDLPTFKGALLKSKRSLPKSQRPPSKQQAQSEPHKLKRRILEAKRSHPKPQRIIPASARLSNAKRTETKLPRSQQTKLPRAQQEISPHTQAQSPPSQQRVRTPTPLSNRPQSASQHENISELRSSRLSRVSERSQPRSRHSDSPKSQQKSPHEHTVRPRSPRSHGRQSRSPHSHGRRSRSPRSQGHRSRSPHSNSRRSRSPRSHGRRSRSPHSHSVRPRSPRSHHSEARSPLTGERAPRTPSLRTQTGTPHSQKSGGRSSRQQPEGHAARGRNKQGHDRQEDNKPNDDVKAEKRKKEVEDFKRKRQRKEEEEERKIKLAEDDERKRREIEKDVEEFLRDKRVKQEKRLAKRQEKPCNDKRKPKKKANTDKVSKKPIAAQLKASKRSPLTSSLRSLKAKSPTPKQRPRPKPKQKRK